MPRPMRRTDTAPGWINRKFRDLERKIDQAAAAKRLPGSSVVINGAERPVVDLLTEPHFTQDVFTVTMAGTQALTLSAEPEPGSEHLYWNGLYQGPSTFTRSGNTISVPDAEGRLTVGDEFTVEYAYRGQHLVVDAPPAPTPPPTANYSDAVLASGPWFYHRLDETGGIGIADSSGNGRASVWGIAPEVTPGLLNPPTPGLARRLYSGGGDSYAYQVGDPTAWTLEFVGDDLTSIGIGQWASLYASSRFRVYMSGGNLAVDVVAGGWPTVTSSGVNLADGARHHIAVTWDDATMTLSIYIDGALRGSANAGGILTPKGTLALQVGVSGNNGTYRYTGVLDEVAWYTRALPTAEVATHNDSLVNG